MFNISIEQKPFTRYHEDKKADTFTVRLGDDFSREDLNKGKEVLEQERDSTALKQLATIGLAFVLQDKKTNTLLQILFKNKRNNKRQGIVTFAPLE